MPIIEFQNHVVKNFKKKEKEDHIYPESVRLHRVFNQCLEIYNHGGNVFGLWSEFKPETKNVILAAKFVEWRFKLFE